MKLDIGCGSHKRGNIGVDISRNSEADVIADAHHLPFRTEAFNQVSAYALLEHVDDPSKALTEMHRICKKRGRLEVLVPTDSRMLRNFLIYFFTFQFKGVTEMYRCNKRREHKWQYTPSTLSLILEKHGFQLLSVEVRSPNFYGGSNRLLKFLEGIHRRCPIYKPHLVARGTKH